jgi:trans-2,3-dihydro-3-hydroxyanthranilate isomerase
MGGMRLDYHVLDVFTDTRFGGNPLAVVLDADGLDGARMQAIAREFNLSETVFVLKPQNGAHTARLRIFTPAVELPFAGHPTVGTAALLAEIKAASLPGDALVVLEEGIGSVRVGVRMRAGSAPFAEFDAPKLPEDAGTMPSVERLAAALSLIPAEVGFENHKPTKFAAGNTFGFVPIASLEAMGKARVAAHHWDTAFKGLGLAGAFLYCRQTVHVTSAFHARVFAPDTGVAEDPATGSAAVGLAGVIQRFDALPDGLHKRQIEQGYEMGRPSTIVLSLEVQHGKLHTVRIGGHAVRVAEGRIEV